mgnify:FL=1
MNGINLDVSSLHGSDSSSKGYHHLICSKHLSLFWYILSHPFQNTIKKTEGKSKVFG